MVINREVIQAIRLRRSTEELEGLLAKGDALAEELLRLSGLLEQGIDPREIKLTPQQLAELLELVKSTETELLMGEAAQHRGSGRSQV